MAEHLPKNRRCGATQQIPSTPGRGWEADPGRFQGWEHGLETPSQLLLVLPALRGFMNGGMSGRKGFLILGYPQGYEE